jgi:hypothetical protein
MSDYTSESLLAFAEPSSISSRQFLTQHYAVPSREGLDYWYAPQTSATVELSGLSQNSFILPQTMKLEYQAISNVQIPVDPPAEAQNAIPYKTAQNVMLGTVGMPFWGAPHLGSVLVEVPGLSSDLGIMTANQQSQRLHGARLLCSGGQGHFEVPQYRESFSIDGRTNLAGGKSCCERVGGVVGAFATNRTPEDDGVPPGVVLKGGFVSYAVPASAFFLLANQTSSALPLPYLTAGSSNLVVRANFAPVEDAIYTIPGRQNNSYSVATYWVTGVQLSYTAVNILDSRVLRAISALFTGQMSIPVAQGVSIPVPMVLGYRAFKVASQTFSGPQATVTMRVPAGVAAAECLLVKIDNPVIFGNRYLTSEHCVIEDMRVTIGSATFPARSLSDLVYTPGTVVRGTGTTTPLLLSSNPVSPLNVRVGTGNIRVATSSLRDDELYQLGRQFFSLWSDDDFADGPMTPFMRLGSAGALGADQFLWGSQKVFVTGPLTAVSYADVPQEVVDFPTPDLHPEALSRYNCQHHPNLFVIPLNSFVPECSPKDRAFGITGIDLRNQADVTLTFRIPGYWDSAQGEQTDVVTPVTSWTVTTALAYSELASLLPSRTDLRYSMSALPSAAGSVVSGGLGTL